MKKFNTGWLANALSRSVLSTNEPVTLTHKRIYILPTLRGLGFVVLILLLLLIALIYNNNLAYLLCFLLASVFFITILHSFKALSGLIIYKGQSTSVFVGESAGFSIHVNNPSSAPRFSLQLHLVDDYLFSLTPQEKQSVTLYSPTQKRGWHCCGEITLSSTYPLGMFRAWSVLHFDMKALVYPKPARELIAFPETAGTQTHQGAVKKGSDDFYGLKEYQNGDPIRHIHWKSFAKGLGLFSKQYSGEAFAELWLSYDMTPGHDTEQRLSQLCRWLVDADKAGLHYGFILPNLKIEPSSGTLHFKKCLEALALF
jgi:uncharacterized protein (DUF58 family)